MNAQPDPKKNEFLALRDPANTSLHPLDSDARKGVLGRANLTPKQWAITGFALLLAIVAII